MNKKIFYLLFSLMVASSLGCTRTSERHADAQSHFQGSSARQGKIIFTHYCAPCHGESGDGFGKNFSYELKPQPPDFTTADFLNNRDDELLYLAISQGSAALGKSNLCPGWGKTFHREEIECTIQYIKELNKQAKADAGE